MRLPKSREEKPLTAHPMWAGLPNPSLSPGNRSCFLLPTPVGRGRPLARRGHPKVYSPFPSPHLGHPREVRVQWLFYPPPPPKSPVFVPLHPREGIYCLDPETPRKTFLPVISTAWPQRPASRFYRNKINTLRGPLLPVGKPALELWGALGPVWGHLAGAHPPGSLEGRFMEQDGDSPQFGERP